MLTLRRDSGWKKSYLPRRRHLAFGIPFHPAYGNDTTAFRPEVWANEAVRLLWEDMVYASLVHRDFEDEIATFGEKVHTRKVGTFKAKRKQNDLDDLEDQDATATKIEVVLNQRAYISFVIGDGERSKSFQDLFQVYLEPAMNGEARLLDQVVAGQVYQFLDSRAGSLEGLTSVTGHDYLLDSRENFNTINVPDEGRMMGLANRSETQLQKTDLFKSAERRGDGGRALVNALLGRVDGWNNFRSNNTPSIRNATKGTATTLGAAANAGATTLTNIVAAVTTGTYITIAGDMTALRVLTSAGAGAAHTVNRPLLRSVANGATVQPYATGLINQPNPIAQGDTTAAVANGYPAGWLKSIVVDGTGIPQQGQLVSFKAAGGTVHAAEYCIVQKISDTEFLLDRPLVDTVADNDIVCYGPNGDFNFGFRKPAVALVNRPLELPLPGTGARAAKAVFNNMSMRVVMTYDGKKEGTRVTVSGLFGVKELDSDQGMVMYG